MKTIVLSRNLAEAQIISDKTKKIICISIYSSGDVPAKIDYAKDVLFLQFDDISWDNIPNTILFNRGHAMEIIDFFYKNLDADCLVVHCDAGISRSPAVAIALRELFFNDREYYKKHPFYNHFVYNKIMVTANQDILPELEYNHVF